MSAPSWGHRELWSDLVPDYGLLDRSEVLEGGEEHMAPFRAAEVVQKVSQLLAQSNQDLILVFDGLCNFSRQISPSKRVQRD